ncbi:hypothetical protein Nepgr_033217 [Nepenthes gracilis]|uniref:Uncharacterized protein n=1 Tax=Nepenthes gracilis TaxID=150966 RepID=A0AAD3TLH6_NEPGR|nr:hypothetical protein Nepgr_033217 [Nepenthes gracilis]
MQGVAQLSWGLASAPPSSSNYVLQEGTNVGSEPPTLPTDASRELKVEELTELVYASTLAQHGVLVIANALSKEPALGPSAALVEETLDDERSAEGQAGSGDVSFGSPRIRGYKEPGGSSVAFEL